MYGYFRENINLYKGVVISVNKLYQMMYLFGCYLVVLNLKGMLTHSALFWRPPPSFLSAPVFLKQRGRTQVCVFAQIKTEAFNSKIWES